MRPHIDERLRLSSELRKIEMMPVSSARTDRESQHRNKETATTSTSKRERGGRTVCDDEDGVERSSRRHRHAVPARDRHEHLAAEPAVAERRVPRHGADEAEARAAHRAREGRHVRVPVGEDRVASGGEVRAGRGRGEDGGRDDVCGHCEHGRRMSSCAQRV